MEEKMVSVPIRGLFNLTYKRVQKLQKRRKSLVSVPIRGLFNLTIMSVTKDDKYLL